MQTARLFRNGSSQAVRLRGSPSRKRRRVLSPMVFMERGYRFLFFSR